MTTWVLSRFNYLYSDHTVVWLVCDSIIESVDCLCLFRSCHGLVHDHVQVETKPRPPKWPRFGWSSGRLDQIARFPEPGLAAFVKADFSANTDGVQSRPWHQVTIERADQVVCEWRGEPFFLEFQSGITSLRNQRVAVDNHSTRGLQLLCKLRCIAFYTWELRLCRGSCGIVQEIQGGQELLYKGLYRLC